MKTEEEKDERMKKVAVEVIELLGDGKLTTGESIIILTRCLASLIASNPDKGKINKTMAAAVTLLKETVTESAAMLEKAVAAGALRMPEEGGGE